MGSPEMSQLVQSVVETYLLDGTRRYNKAEVADRSEAATVRAIVYEPARVPEVRKTLGFLGCDTAINELGKLVAIHVPSFVPYGPVRDYLETQARSGLLGYEASCLMHTV